MQVSIIQIDSYKGTFQNRVDRAKLFIEKDKKSDFILLPELWAVGFMSFDDFIPSAQSINGELVTTFKELANKKKIHIHMGSFIEKKDEKYFNTSLIFNPSGEIIGQYRKIHLFTYKSKEAEILDCGEKKECASINQQVFGMATCYDLRFPELFRSYLKNNISGFLVPSAWPLKRLEHYRLFCQTRAIENLSFVISPNCCGGLDNKKLAGHSMIVDPFGEIIAEGSEDECIIEANIDLEKVSYWRTNFSALTDRKNPKFYE